jgi:superoxide dismutase
VGGILGNGQSTGRRRRLGAADLVAALVNQWAMDHSTTLAGGHPILALDMYEHSYHIDYGAQAAAYVDAFMAAINWPNVAAA